MVLGFNEAFIPAIVAGTKIHTIRAGQRWQAGAVAQFYARAQQPDCYEFWGPRPIVAVQAVVLTATALRIDGRPLGPAEQLALARADGFATAAELLAFFADQPMPFHGQLLHWTDCRY
ncbi:hypothetical protein [Hymenobacter coccineus]|uniref:ASCH domain-containing protein n=1 Tax=Hymenobacter coccineus TaxID=1908235 RepID=A0A1G1SYR3_9BACT|nr:hypothetical protein [Hymenobacter coccineus]OGX83761.1 hypothetical protein BEN49_12100 [Hymenobacter coccineus]